MESVNLNTNMQPKNVGLIVQIETAFIGLIGAVTILSFYFVITASISGFTNFYVEIFKPIIRGPFAPVITDDANDFNFKNMTETDASGHELFGATGVVRLSVGAAIMAGFWILFVFGVQIILFVILRKGFYREESGKCKAWWITQALICVAVIFMLIWNALFGSFPILVYIFGGSFAVYRVISIYVVFRFASKVSASSTYSFHP